MGLKAISRLVRGSADYEEGSWTPRLGTTTGTDGTHAYGVQVGRYIRIGNLVWAHCHISLASLDGAMSGVAAIKDLPFTTSNVAGLNGAATFINSGGVKIDTVGGYYKISGRTAPNTTRIEIIEEGDNVGAAQITEADLSNATILQVTMMYSTDLN